MLYVDDEHASTGSVGWPTAPTLIPTTSTVCTAGDGMSPNR